MNYDALVGCCASKKAAMQSLPVICMQHSCYKMCIHFDSKSVLFIKKSTSFFIIYEVLVTFTMISVNSEAELLNKLLKEFGYITVRAVLLYGVENGQLRCSNNETYILWVTITGGLTAFKSSGSPRLGPNDMKICTYYTFAS